MRIKIDNKEFQAEEGETILDVAQKNGIEIPTLCHHPDTKIKESCRVCVVQVKDRGLLPACSTKIEEGMEVETANDSIEKARRVNLELLFSQHQEECFDCIWNMNCKMLDLAKEYRVKINKFKDRKDHYPTYHFGPIEFDSSKCIDCRNCVEICENQGVGFLEIRGKGHLMEVLPSGDPDKDCVYCGQCIVHCPAGSFESVGEFERIKDPFKNKEKTVIFQIAPAVRATIGEEFGVTGKNSMKELVAALKELGGDKVFDVPVGADITTMEESKELLSRIENDDLPLFTACCPSWVKFVEFYYPDLVSRLTTVRSPHIILGGLVKKHFSEKKGIDPEELYITSVMPCVSKKYEIERKELEVEGVRPVDNVMTTREVGRLLKLNKMELNETEGEDPDDPFGEASSSGVTYGLSGGVMRSAVLNLTGKEAELKEVKEGLKEGEVRYEGRHLRVAVVHGLSNAREILEELRKGRAEYDYVEVMACPGGCIGGGGQSVPTCMRTIQERRKGLEGAGERKKKRKADDNPEAKRVYETVLCSEKEISKICHTNYQKAERSIIKRTKKE